MKRIIGILLCGVLLFVLPFTGRSQSAALSSGDFQYEVSAEKTAMILRYTGSAAELTIPATLAGYSVKGIGDNALRDCGFLKKVVFPDGVETIGSQAFYNCTGLESVAFPGSLREIGDLAFAYCTNLKNVVIPEGTTLIGEYAFGDCASLASAVVPASVTAIGPDAFSGMAAGFVMDGGQGSFAQEYAGLNSIPFEGKVSLPPPTDSAQTTTAETVTVLDAVKEDNPEAAPEDAEMPDNTVTATITLHFPHADRTGTYVGEMRDGFARGQGSFTCTPSDGVSWIYDGIFENSAMSGYGTVTWIDGRQFWGSMRDNQPYEGEWLAGDAAVYAGGFTMLQDSGLFAFHGQGKLSDRLGRAVYEGMFESGYLDETAAARLARTQALEPQCAALPNNEYTALMSQPDAYAGKLAELTGVVDSVLLDEKQGETQFILLNNRSKACPVRVCYRYGAGEEKVKAGAGVTLWGSIFGIRSVENGKGKTTDMPDVDADIIMLTQANQKRTAMPAALTVAKQLEGGNLNDHRFSFALAHVYQAAEMQADPVSGVQREVLVNRTEQLQEKTSARNGKVAFDPIKYTAEDIGRFYTYSVTEIPGGELGITYDPMEVTITVFVADGGGMPIAQVFYPPDTTFNNVYKASGGLTLQAQKELKGREMKDGEFTFELRLGKELLQTKMNGPGGGITFDPILYTQEDIGKTYSYRIIEVRGNEAGITCDIEPRIVKVTITDAGDGKLDASAAYPRDMTFHNSYKAAGEAKLLFSVKLENRELKGTEFNFELRLGEKSLQKKTNDKEGAVTFLLIRYTQADIGNTYVYEIRQIPGKEPGMTYDPSVKSAQVSVTDAGNGKLDVEVEYLTDTQMVNLFDPSADPTLLSGNWNLNLTVTEYSPEDFDTNVRIGESLNMKWTVKMDPKGNGTVTTDKGSWAATFLNGLFKTVLESGNAIYQYEGSLKTENNILTIIGNYAETHPDHVIYADLVMTKEK